MIDDLIPVPRVITDSENKGYSLHVVGESDRWNAGYKNTDYWATGATLENALNNLERVLKNKRLQGHEK